MGGQYSRCMAYSNKRKTEKILMDFTSIIEIKSFLFIPNQQ